MRAPKLPKKPLNQIPTAQFRKLAERVEAYSRGPIREALENAPDVNLMAYRHSELMESSHPAAKKYAQFWREVANPIYQEKYNRRAWGGDEYILPKSTMYRGNPVKKVTKKKASKKKPARKRVAINAPSRITKKAPSKRLRSRRARNAKPGYFPNPTDQYVIAVYFNRDISYFDGAGFNIGKQFAARFNNQTAAKRVAEKLAKVSRGDIAVCPADVDARVLRARFEGKA